MVAAVSAQEVLSCVVCGRLSSAALLLDCLHSCCEACAVGAARDPDASAVACPKCREVSSFSAHGPNRVAALLAPAAAAARSIVPPTAGAYHAEESADAAVPPACSNAVGDEATDDAGGGDSEVNGDPEPRPRSGDSASCCAGAISAVGLPHIGSGEGGDRCGDGGGRIAGRESHCQDNRACGRGRRAEASPRFGTGNATMANSAAAVDLLSETDRSSSAAIDASLQRRLQQPIHATPGAAICALHDEKCNLLCMHCRALMCSTCIRPCLDSKHEVEHRDGRRASEFVRGLAEGLSRWLGELEERSRDGDDDRGRHRVTINEAHGQGDDGGDDDDDDAGVDKKDGAARRKGHGDDDSRGRRRRPLDDLHAARLAAAAEVLLHNKRRALAAIERAYGAASQALRRLAERLAAEAGASAAASSSLGDRARQAIAYGRCVLECGDLVSLLQQYELLVSRAQLLLDEYGGRTAAAPLWSDSRAAAASGAAAGDAVRESIIVESALPDNLDELCQLWIGVPKLIALAADPTAALSHAATAGVAAAANSADRPVALPGLQSAKSVSPRCDVQSSHLNQPPPPASAADDSSGHGATVVGGAAAAKSSIGLRQLGGSLSMPVKCCDVAITAAGHLLLAAKEQGVKEYDLRGREMSCWLPRPPAGGGGGGGGGRADSACTIEVLHDGRLAVGLSRSRCVVLLRRCSRAAAAAASATASSSVSSSEATAMAAETPPAANCDVRCAAAAASGADAMSASAAATTTMGGDTWIEDRVVARLQSEPRRTSAFADVLAIVEGVASSSLVLVCLPRAHEMLRRELGYCIECVAVAGQTVVTSSYDKLESPPPLLPAAAAPGADGVGGDRRKSHVIECYNFSGERLWRRPTSRLVRDLCPTPSGTVLYLALCESRAVAAIRSDDGCELADVLSSDSHGIQKPLRLSIGRGHRALLAVLNSDCKTVTVYTAADVKR